MQLIFEETVAIIAVFVFPPNESWRSLVNFDYLYGGMDFPVAKDPMTFPKVVRDKLIFFNSSKCSTLIVSLFCIFSEPARSHKLIFILLVNKIILYMIFWKERPLKSRG